MFPISTLLKIYLYSEALTNWRKKCAQVGTVIGNQCRTNLLFANDQVIKANDEEDMDYMILKLIEQYENWELTINITKTEYLRIKMNKEILNFLLQIKKVAKN